MRNYGLVLLALLALIGITYISGVDLGQVIINYQELTFELTILTAIIYIALLYIGVRMLSSLLDLPITIKALLKRRHQASLKQNIMNALKALEEMNFNKAIKLLNQVSLRSKRGVFLNALTLQLEYLNGIDGHTETLIKEFLPKNQNEKSFIQLLVADYALRHKNFSLAKELLIDTTHNNSSNYLNFLMTLYWIKLEDVEKAYKCLISQTITDTHAQNKIVRLFFKEYANETNIEIEKIELLLKKVSREFYDDARSLGSLISLYVIAGDHQKSYQLIRTFFNKKSSERLLLLLSSIKVNSIEDKLSYLESRIDSKSSPALFIALSQCCAELELWGKARSYIDSSIEIYPSKTALIISANLFLRQNNYESSIKELAQANKASDRFEW